MNRFAMALLLLSVGAIPSDAAERTWTDSTGKFQVDAELVEVQDGTVVLRRADGRTVRVPLKRLSKSDQQYVAEHQTADDTAAADELKITAEAEWGPAFFAPEGDDAPEPPLQISILIGGKAAAQSSAFGGLKLESIKDGRDRELEGKLDSMMGGFMNDQDQMQLIDRTSQFKKHPKDGVRIPIEIENPPSPIDSIKEIRGTVKLRTGGRHENVVVEDIKKQLDQPIDDATLKQAKISVQASSQTSEDSAPDDGFGFGFGGGAAETIVVKARGELEPLTRVELVDADGKLLETVMTGSAGFGQQIHYSLGFAKPIPEDARLRLVLHLDAEEITVPFKINDIKVPPVPEQPTGFPGFPGQ